MNKIQPVFFKLDDRRIRIFAMFKTKDEADFCASEHSNVEVLAMAGAFLVVYKDDEPTETSEALAVLRVTADEVRAFNSTLTDDEVRDVLSGVQDDMQADSTNILYWIDEVITKRELAKRNEIMNSVDGQRSFIADLLARERAGEVLESADYEIALSIYKKRMAVLNYDHWEFYYADDIKNNPITGLSEILACFPSLPDEVN